MWKITSIIVFFFSFILCHSSPIPFRDLEKLSCDRRDSCQLGNATDFFSRNCECDPFCSIFGDCCIDAIPSKPSHNHFIHKYKCVHFGQQLGLGAYMVGACPTHYSGPLLEKCKKSHTSDPFMSIPVTDRSSGITYRSRYCAECNDVNPLNLQTWLVSLAFKHGSGIRERDILHNLQYHHDLKHWGIEKNGEFRNVALHFENPQVAIRLCRAGIITTCTASSPCPAYTAVVYDYSGRGYKNPHCAVCNGEQADKLLCERPDTTFMRRMMGDDDRSNKHMNFAFLLDMNFLDDGGNVGKVEKKQKNVIRLDQECPSRRSVYDPFLKKCRAIVCALPGYRFIAGKCRRFIRRP